MAIPGFLKFLFNVDFSIGKELARGGGGSVSLGTCMTDELIYRSNGQRELIVKRVCKLPGVSLRFD